MFRACSRCGKIHSTNYKCNKGKQYNGGMERSLRSTHRWTAKSLEIREKANYLCEVCKDMNIFNYDNLEVHHIDKLTDNQDKLLDNYNLVCLCVEHHKQADRGELDKDYLRGLAIKRENS